MTISKVRREKAQDCLKKKKEPLKEPKDELNR
jgi:hypothetical protein